MVTATIRCSAPVEFVGTTRDDQPMRMRVMTVVVTCAVLVCSSCSVLFMERLPDDHRRGDPAYCTASKGWVAWDGLFVAADVITAIAAFSAAGTASDSGLSTTPYFGLMGAAVVDGAIHAVSAASGSRWVDECRDARAAADAYTPTLTRAVPPVAQPANGRKTVYGAKPMFCATVTVDIGECWINEETCKASIEQTGAPGCEQRNAASCFNATKTLDGTKTTVCAVSIKDCETRRAELATNPDYTVTNCGIYRVAP